MAYAIPDHIRAAYAAADVDPNTLRYAVYAACQGSDLDAAGGKDVYIATSADTLFLLRGNEVIRPVRGAKKIEIVFQSGKLRKIPLENLGDLKVERLISTGRLWSDRGEDSETLLTFFVGSFSQMESLSKLVNALRKNETADTPPPEDDLFCPRCGARYPEEKRKVCPKCLNSSSIARRLFGFFLNYLPRLVLVFAAMVAGTVFQLLSPIVGTRMFFDEVLTEGGDYFGMVLGMVLVLFTVRALGQILSILYSYLLGGVMPYIIFDLKMRIFEAMQRLSVGYYTSKHTGDLMNRVNKDADRIYWFFIDGFPYVIVNGLLIVGIVLIMMSMSWVLALIAFALVPIILVIFQLMWRIFHRLHHRQWVADSNLTSFVSDAIAGSRVIKAFAREEEEIGRFKGLGDRLRQADVALTNTDMTTFPLIFLLMFLGQVIVTAVGGIMVVRNEISLGTLITFISYLTMLYGPLDFMSWVSNWWSRCVDAAQRVFEIIDARSDVTESESPSDHKTLKGDVDLSGVFFEYEPARPVIKGLDLSVGAGKMLGIVGKTGAGKTTLANLIARLYDVTSGEVKLDGINVKDLPLEAIRGHVGIVSQEIYLFIGTIADNIRYAQPGAAMEDVIAAAKAAFAHEFIMKLPDAYETRVGAGGQDLSGGERQRLSIARTIIQNPKILILDEATAAMDTETEQNIQNALGELQSGRTTIAIAHRMSTLRDADSLAVIQEGKVVEAGTHDELMRLKGEYFKLYMIQMESLKTIRMDA